MAQWIKFADSSIAGIGFDGYANINQLAMVFVAQQSDNTWAIQGVSLLPGPGGGGGGLVLKGGFATQAAAQTALDNAITNAGGSI